jgi:hypothetical protein
LSVADIEDQTQEAIEAVFGLPRPQKVKKNRAVVRRLVASSSDIFTNPPEQIAFQHTVLCQTALPYKNPGDDVREWEREQGNVALSIEAGKAKDPHKSGFVKLGLPWGEKARLVLIHLNTEAVRTESPVIEVEDSLTAFVSSIGLATHGRNIRMVKEQLARLSASRITLGMMEDGKSITVNTQIVNAFDLWTPTNANQCVLWPSTVQLSQEYFESLARHAVPLDHRAIAALGHSALALDVYAWLAQRLHRVSAKSPHYVGWVALKEQFGAAYGRMTNFRRDFRNVLDMVLTQYRDARIEMDENGFFLYNSPPPVVKKFFIKGV